MGCNCGEIGCWPFLVRINVGQHEVVWSDFRQPHRNWRYDTLGSLRFDRGQYDQAVGEAAELFAQTARYTDEMASAFARSIRRSFAGSEELLNGLLVALARRGELPPRTDDKRQALFRDQAQLKAAAIEVAEILGLTEAQGLVIAGRDLNALDASAITDQLAEQKRIAALPDADLRAAYGLYVRDMRRGRFR